MGYEFYALFLFFGAILDKMISVNGIYNQSHFLIVVHTFSLLLADFSLVIEATL